MGRINIKRDPLEEAGDLISEYMQTIDLYATTTLIKYLKIFEKTTWEKADRLLNKAEKLFVEDKSLEHLKQNLDKWFEFWVETHDRLAIKAGRGDYFKIHKHCERLKIKKNRYHRIVDKAIGRQNAAGAYVYETVLIQKTLRDFEKGRIEI